MKKVFIFTAFIFMLLNQKISYAIDLIDNPPSETIILKFPNNSHLHWKEITRCVNEKKGLVEYIPSNQAIQNWSELICIQYNNMSNLKLNSVEYILDTMREITLSSYPGNEVTWNIIEKNKNDIIYEWILHKPYEDIPPQHEVARGFLTPIGFHRIGFTRQNAEMSFEERMKWIKLLKESASVVSFEEGSMGLSLSNRFHDSLDLGPAFQDWKVISTQTFENGHIWVHYVPHSQKGTYITECLVVNTCPNFNDSSLSDLFEVEKKSSQSEVSKKLKFHILKKTPTEIIYNYSHPKDHLRLNAINRSFISNHGYYSLIYRCGLNDEMKKEEILKWKKRLESIQVRNPSQSINDSSR